MMEEKILIVDDDESESKKNSSILTEVGYEVIVCKSGSEALEYLNRNPVELVLLDLLSPPDHHPLSYPSAGPTRP